MKPVKEVAGSILSQHMVEARETGPVAPVRSPTHERVLLELRFRYAGDVGCRERGKPKRVCLYYTLVCVDLPSAEMAVGRPHNK